MDLPSGILASWEQRFGFLSLTFASINALSMKNPIPDGRTDAKTRVRVFVVMLHMVTFDIFCIAGAHGKMMGGIMGQVVGKVTDEKTGHERRHPLRAIEEDAQNQVEQAKKDGCQGNADREGHDQAGFHLGLNMVDAVEEEEDAFLAEVGGFVVE